MDLGVLDGYGSTGWIWEYLMDLGVLDGSESTGAAARTGCQSDYTNRTPTQTQ